jgi:hypothetical protein
MCANRIRATHCFLYVTRTVHRGKRDAQRAAAALVSAVGAGMLPAARGTVAQVLVTNLRNPKHYNRATSSGADPKRKGSLSSRTRALRSVAGASGSPFRFVVASRHELKGGR